MWGGYFNYNQGVGGFFGGGGGGNFWHRWHRPGYNYHTMPGYMHVDYSSGWNPNHDQMLMNNINIVFQRYDFNYSGQL